MKIEPYLFFEGRADEAIEFYKTALGAKVNRVMRYKDCPDSSHPFPPELLPKVMHASLRVGNMDLLLSDGHCKDQPKFIGFALTLNVPSDTDATKYFNALADGGKITMPLGKTFFSSNFGMLTDRFGVQWMVIVEG